MDERGDELFRDRVLTDRENEDMGGTLRLSSYSAGNILKE